MSTGARVDDVDSIKLFRSALIKFGESANVALGDAESEMQRTLGWLERDQLTHWTSETRKRTEAVGRAQEARRMKKLFKTPTGQTPTPVEEEKALAVAMRRLQEAQQKLLNVRRWAGRLQKEIHVYKGGVQRFATSLQSDLPRALSRLDTMIAALEEYVSLAPLRMDAVAGSSSNAESMARPDAEPLQQAEGAANETGEQEGGA